MFKNILVYRIDADCELPSAMALEEALGLGRFVACTPTQVESSGWIEPRGEKHGALLENVGGQLILKLKTESKSVPAAAIKDALEERMKKIEEETGRKPGGKRKRELKEEIVHELLPRAFSKTGVTTIWIDPKAKLLVVGAGSIKKGDKVTTALIEAAAQAGASMSVRLIQTNTSPATAMSHWLSTQEAPAGFTVDRECELKQPDTTKSTVRYSRHTLEIEEIVEHIKQGKVPTKLALTWEGRVSFILADDMSLKMIELLDVALEGKTKGESKDDSGFDADVAIATGELSKMLPVLFDVLGGEKSADGVEPPNQESDQVAAANDTSAGAIGSQVEPLAA